MNTTKRLNTTLTTALLAVAAFGASTAMAGTGETDGDVPAPFVSSRSRADVQAELQVARHQPGGLVVGQASQLNPVALANTVDASLRSRAEVKAEVLAARVDGTLDIGGEAQHPEHPLNRVTSHRTLAGLQR